MFKKFSAYFISVKGRCILGYHEDRALNPGKGEGHRRLGGGRGCEKSQTDRQSQRGTTYLEHWTDKCGQVCWCTLVHEIHTCRYRLTHTNCHAGFR